jgi:hypothetical protein
LVAFGLYGATIGLCEIWHAFQPDVDWKKSARTFAILTAPAAIILGYFVTYTANNLSKEASEWDSFAKFLSILHGMNGYSAYLSVADILAIAAMTFFMFKERCLSVSPRGKWIAIGLLVLIIVLPFRVAGGDLPSLRIHCAGKCSAYRKPMAHLSARIRCHARVISSN